MRAETAHLDRNSYFKPWPRIAGLGDDTDNRPHPSRTFAPGSQAEQGAILIVEDVTLSACLTQAMLAHHDIASVIAYGGPAALEWLSEHPTTVILCDISMPGMNGIELAREIRARWQEKSPRLIAFTAYPREHERSRLLEAGFDDFVAKPASAEDLAAVVRKWL